MLEVVALTKESFSNKRLKKIEEYCKFCKTDIIRASLDNNGYIFINDVTPSIYSYLIEMCCEKNKDGVRFIEIHYFNDVSPYNIDKNFSSLNMISYREFLKKKGYLRFLFTKN